MDYAIINESIEEISALVSQYKEKKGYSDTLSEKLTISLLGYYLAFGSEIFKRITLALDGVELHEFQTEEEYIAFKDELTPMSKGYNTADPGTYWDYKYDENQKFIGAKPIVMYSLVSKIQDVFSIIHELSHVIEGTSAQVISEDENNLVIKNGFTERNIDKETNLFKSTQEGITELITVAIEHKILREFLKLDPTQITNANVQSFLEENKSYQTANVMLRSYGSMSALFKDLIDSDAFFEIIKKYHYDNQPESITEEFNSFDSRLNFNKIVTYAEQTHTDDISTIFYYSKSIQKQMDIFNEATDAKPDKRLIIVI